MAGANLNYSRAARAFYKILRLLRYKQGGFVGSGKVCQKAGAPSNNTADDEPNEVGDILLDTTNDRVYISTAHTDSTTHTWTRIDEN